MKLSPRYKMPFRRRKETKTDYKKRLKMLKSDKPRLVVRKSLRYITVQIAEFDGKGDRVIASATSKELKKLGWKFACDNIPASYLTGLMIGRKCAEKKISEVILDSGLYTSVKGSKIYAVVKGASDSGLKIPIDSDILPPEERIKGGHIEERFKGVGDEFERVKGKVLGG